jgi:predicted FMN-binding regulatory protein PaiB/GNAT superfamily N-acetyltransferase
MYLPRPFTSDAATIATEEGFGWLVCDDPAIAPTPVPFVIAPPSPASPGDLLFHVARNNPIVEALKAGKRAKMLVTGPHGYVSSAWYKSPKQVPTWNYLAASYTGTLSVEDARTSLAALLATYDPALVIAAEVTEALLPGIVGGRLTVTEAPIGKAKLSQNCAPEDASAVAETLWRSGNFRLAAEMRGRLGERMQHTHVQNTWTLEEVEDLLEELFPLVRQLREALDLATFVERVQHARSIGYRILVLRETSTSAAIAYAGFRPVTTLARGAHIHVDDLVVHEDHRGTGAGAALLGHIEEMARTFRTSGAAVYLDARPTALGFYKKRGYSVHPAPVVKR